MASGAFRRAVRHSPDWERRGAFASALPEPDPTDNAPPPGFFDRLKTGLAEGGIVGGLIGSVADPYAERVGGRPNWYDALQGVNQYAGRALRSAIAGDPGLVSRERALETQAAQQQQALGYEGMRARSSMATADIALRKEQRREKLISRLEAAGIDPNTAEGRQAMKNELLAAGEVDAVIDMLKADATSAKTNYPHEISFKRGGEEVSRIYQPSGEVEEFSAPRQLPGGELKNFRQAWTTLKSEYRSELGTILNARDANARVISMAANALTTGNALEAVAAVRSYIQAIDSSVVREEEYRQIAGSIGILKQLADEIARAGGSVPANTIKQTREAAVHAMGLLDQIIENRQQPYRAAADQLQIPWSMIGAEGLKAPGANEPGMGAAPRGRPRAIRATPVGP